MNGSRSPGSYAHPPLSLDTVTHSNAMLLQAVYEVDMERSIMFVGVSVVTGGGMRIQVDLGRRWIQNERARSISILDPHTLGQGSSQPSIPGVSG